MRIGIDLGGTNIGIGLIDSAGRILARNEAQTRAGRSADDIADTIAKMAKKIADGADIDFIGLGSPGTIDPAGRILFAGNLGFENIDMADMLAARLGQAVHLENDANCAALGEVLFGAARGYRHCIVITFGTGIGSGFIIDGKIYRGPFFGAGEAGHHIIAINGRPCTCGKNGCWEAYASAAALAKSGGANNAKEIFDDADKIGLIDSYFEYIAIGISNLINIFQPEIIVLGGGVSKARGFLENVTKKTIPLIFANSLKTKIALAELGNDAGILGAAFIPSD